MSTDARKGPGRLVLALTPDNDAEIIVPPSATPTRIVVGLSSERERGKARVAFVAPQSTRIKRVSRSAGGDEGPGPVWATPCRACGAKPFILSAEGLPLCRACAHTRTLPIGGA
jgi:hypothetical protein